MTIQKTRLKSLSVTDNAYKSVEYTYDTSHRLSTVTQGAFNAQAITTYQYNQTSPSGTGNLTTIIVNDQCGGTNCGTPLEDSIPTSHT